MARRQLTSVLWASEDGVEDTPAPVLARVSHNRSTWSGWPVNMLLPDTGVLSAVMTLLPGWNCRGRGT